MIQGHDILCFAPGPWADIWRNRHQIMTRLALGNRVLYVEPWAQLRPLLRQLRQGDRGASDSWQSWLRQVQPDLWVYHPPRWAPQLGSSRLAALTETIYMGLLRRELAKLGFERPILWLYLPDMGNFAGKFGEKLLIYHIVDEYAGYAGVTESWRPVMQGMERDLARRADLVFVSSTSLFDRKRSLNPRTVLIRNAVDFPSFAAAADAGTLPPVLAGLRRPIIGYVGAINEKIDLDLLLHVAHSMVEATLLMVGSVSVMSEASRRTLIALQDASNVCFLGPKDVSEVPAYVAACDVCLLPYRTNEWTQNIDSLKSYEYLACGKPVVATGVPTALQFGEVFRVASGAQEFVAMIDEELRTDTPDLRKKRQAIAAQNTWDHRIAQISQAIETTLNAKASRC